MTILGADFLKAAITGY